MSSYHRLKSIISEILPKSLLFKYEYQLRYFSYLSHKGNKYQCNVCESNLDSFVQHGHDRLCPRCGSLQRTRRLWSLLSNEFLKDKSQRILDFSPSRNIFRNMIKRGGNYTSSDLSGDFIADVSFDIQNIAAANEQFDLIICYHVLVHIDDDAQAMKELCRVLNLGGVCLIQTPFKEGEIYENPSITTPEEREIHFGQNDHVRIYSVNGLVERLKNAGFEVEIRTFNEGETNKNGFAKEETVLVCRKN